MLQMNVSQVFPSKSRKLQSFKLNMTHRLASSAWEIYTFLVWSTDVLPITIPFHNEQFHQSTITADHQWLTAKKLSTPV